MPAPPFNYASLTGGFNTYNAYDDLADSEARDVSNVQGTFAGAIVKRGGFSTVATVTNPLKSLHAPVQLHVVGGDNVAGTLIRIDVTNGTQVTLKSGLTVGTLWEWVVAPSIGGQGSAYGMDGTNTPQQWNSLGSGTTASAWTATDPGGTVPNGTYCVFHQNQVFVTGVAANPSRVYWSGLGDPTAWNPANLNGSGFMDFDPGDGDSISGIGRVGPYLAVFKSRKTWILVDPATATARRLSDSIGCMSHRSIASGVEGLYFLSLDRVYVTNGSKITPLSDKIQPTVEAIRTRGQAAGCYINQHYYLSVNLNGSPNDTILDYDARLQSWWKHPIGVSQWAVQPSYGTTTVVPYAANASSGLVSKAFQPGVFQDNGSNFTWSWSGPWQSPTFYRRRRFPTPYFRKRLRQIRYDGLGQVDFSLCKDFNTAPTLVASDIFSNSSITKEARAYGQGVANVFSIVFSGTYPTQGQVNQYTLMVKDRADAMVTSY